MLFAFDPRRDAIFLVSLPDLLLTTAVIERSHERSNLGGRRLQRPAWLRDLGNSESNLQSATEVTAPTCDGNHQSP